MILTISSAVVLRLLMGLGVLVAAAFTVGAFVGQQLAGDRPRRRRQ